ncbi:MAG: VWA domain-containing protein [Actinomycetota bacterium]
MTWLRVPLACLVFAVVLAPFAARGAEPGAACPAVTSVPDWTTIAAPSFPAGEPPTIAGFAVHPHAPDQLLVTNGKTVLASLDGGCTWEAVFSFDVLESLGLTIAAPAATVRSIVIPEDPALADTIYLLIEERIGGAVSRPHVLVKHGAAAWTDASDGLAPVTGNILRMRAAPSDGDVVYLLMNMPGLGGELYATVDGGTSWQKRGNTTASEFVIDPKVPDELWLTGGAGLFHSVDGGRSASHIPYLTQPVSVVDVFRAKAGAPSRIVAYEVEGGSMSRSDDGGKTWVPFGGPPQVPLSIAHGNGADDMVISAHGAFHRFQSPRYWIEVNEDDGQTTNEEYEDIHDVQVDRTATPAAFGFTASAIKKYTGFSITLPPIISSTPLKKSDAVLSSAVSKLRLEPGESDVVDYKLDLPPAPTPLDVYFLLDTTSSMKSSINGLTEGIHRIAQELAASRIDVRFGLAEYKDYPIAGYGDAIENDVPYRQKRDLGPADGELIAALESLEASGGGRVHEAEAQLTALFQSVTGDGEPGFIPADQEASFRSNALKVVINITDAPFDNSPGHPSPPFDVVARELKSRGVLQIGLGVFGPNGSDGAMASLSEMAKETGTRAPAGGVDCNDDGHLDIAAGAPLVCEITDEESAEVLALAPAILASLRALTDAADVGLVPTEGAGFVTEISPATYPAVNVKDPNLLDFSVTYTCPATGSTSGLVNLAATVAGQTAASTVTKVVCGPLRPDEVVPPKEPDPPAVVGVAPLPAPNPGVAPVPPPPPPPAPATQTQPQPQPHVQAALAQQEQDQVQVALAASFDPATESEYSFSSYSRRRGPGAGSVLYMSSLIMTAAAAGFALRRRVQPSFSRSRGVSTRRPM